MKRLSVGLALCLASATPVAAQLAFDASVGPTLPVGQYSRGLGDGVDLMGAVEWHPVPVVPFTMRVELGWDRISNHVVDLGAQDLTHIAIDGIVGLTIPTTRFHPYAIAGVGIYHVSENNLGEYGLGVNVGGGLQYRFPLVQPFLEVRYQHGFFFQAGGLSFVPFQFGVRILVP